jgi:acetyl-CoA carboxylase carboxyl transferase subunit beta
MGSVVGKKSRLIEYATKKDYRYLNLCFRWSSYARRHFKFNANGKISAALHVHQSLQIYYISVLTSPTTGGVTASFNVRRSNFAEPKAVIGFATTCN